MLSSAIVLQLVPAAPSALAAVSPSTQMFLRDYVQVPDEAVAAATDRAVGAGTIPASHPLSLRPRATVTALAFTLALGAMVSGALFGLGLKQARHLAAGLLVLGFIVALDAIVQRSVSNGRI